MNIIDFLEMFGGYVLDAIVPPRARAARTKARGIESFRLSPAVHELLGIRITTLLDYKESHVRDLVQSLKYDRSSHAANIASKILSEYLLEELSGERLFSTKRVLLVPVPLHKQRERERGFNQIAFVVEALPEEFRTGPSAYLSPEVLIRTRPTKQQAGLSRHERLSNVAGAFSCTSDLTGTRVFLVDDVTTTGATLANAANPLRRAGAEVSLIALARA